MQRSHIWNKHWGRLALAALLSGGAHAAAPAPPIVIGVSVGAIGDTEARGLRMIAGAMAAVARVNAAGGVNGRQLQLEVMDDEGNPRRHAENLRRLAQDKRAVAFIGCIGDLTCLAAGEVAAELRIPLVAPLSGRIELTRERNPYVFRMRADYTREAEAIAKQFKQLGCTEIALLSEAAAEPEPIMRRAMEAQGLKVNVIRFDGSTPASMSAAVTALGAARYDAVLLNVSLPAVEKLVDAGLAERPEWPRTLMTTANGNLTPLITSFKGRIVGFTQVVPNPSLLAHPLSRELNEDSDRGIGPRALSFDGIEAYIGVRVLAEALRKAGPNLPPRKARARARVFEWMGATQLQGELSPGPGQRFRLG